MQVSPCGEEELPLFVHPHTHDRSKVRYNKEQFITNASKPGVEERFATLVKRVSCNEHDHDPVTSEKPFFSRAQN